MFKTVYTDMFDLLDNIMSTEIVRPTMKTTSGLKAIMNRPHNLYTEKKDNIVSKYILETVYTPWRSSDIKCVFVTDSNGPKLVVNVGTAKAEKPVDDTQVYHGISNKAFNIELPLIGIKVKPEDIVVTATDGILRIEIPVDLSDNTRVEIPVKS